LTASGRDANSSGVSVSISCGPAFAGANTKQPAFIISATAMPNGSYRRVCKPNWAWRSNRAFLLVNVPEMTVLGLAGEPWHRRTIVTFDFAIGAFDERR